MVEPLSSREKILDVAESLFARRGYTGVGLREVALAAGLSKSSLFHHFRGKAPLYGEVLARVLTRIEERVTPVLRQPDGPAQRFERWISALIDHLAEHPTTARLLLRALFEDEEFASDPPAEAERAEAILASIVAGVQGLLREGMQQGVFRRVSVGHTLQTLIDRRHRLPLRVGRDRRDDARPAAVLGRVRRRAQGRGDRIARARDRRAHGPAHIIVKERASWRS
jgi:AcrR family transcriptional regulator